MLRLFLNNYDYQVVIPSKLLVLIKCWCAKLANYEGFNEKLFTMQDSLNNRASLETSGAVDSFPDKQIALKKSKVNIPPLSSSSITKGKKHSIAQIGPVVNLVNAKSQEVLSGRLIQAHKKIGSDCQIGIGRDSHKKRGSDCQIEIGRDSHKKIGSDCQIGMGRDSHKKIGSDCQIGIGSDCHKKIGRDCQIKIGRDSREKAGSDCQKKVGSDCHHIAGENVLNLENKVPRIESSNVKKKTSS